MKFLFAKLKGYLKEPYPFYYRDRTAVLLLLLGISVLSFLFSFFFEPFEVNRAEHKINGLWILGIHAFLPFPITYVYLHILNSQVKDEQLWTLGKEILQLSVLLIFVGLGSFLIRDVIYTNSNNWSLHYLVEEIQNSFLIGFLLLIIVLPLNLERLIKKHRHHLRRIKATPSFRTENTNIHIQGTAANDAVSFHLSDFLFAKVESNYTEVYCTTSGALKKHVLRITLKELQEQLNSSSKYVQKTHRSYLVNLKAIEEITGNAQGYQLSLTNCPLLVPVSRANITLFNAAYGKL